MTLSEEQIINQFDELLNNIKRLEADKERLELQKLRAVAAKVEAENQCCVLRGELAQLKKDNKRLKKAIK